MMPYDESRDRVVQRLLSAMALDDTIAEDSFSQTLAGMMRETISPTVVAHGGAERARRMLSRAVENRRKTLELGAVLGEGGMGIVRSARQSDLGREVAVKSVREELVSEEATAAMLREAWATGTLEHPNIVPVYYVDSCERGRPLIVLKRIEGTSWSTMINDPKAVRDKFGARDLIDWNLGVLEKVINAVRYAHRRGVVHRDLKPDNVMLGEFGEVYVLDWGIAVSLIDDDETLLPLASEIDRMAGTPAFMAPEMLGLAVDERSDVYLLGAILYQIIAGRPPHRGSTIEELVDCIRLSAPSFPDSAPAELRSICQKAMAPQAEDRFASATELGVAIQAFRAHRGSLRLLHKAQGNLERLRRRAQEGAELHELQEMLGECRYGFQSALEVWSENHEASAGLREAVELVAKVALRSGDPRVAGSILRELADPSPDLSAQVKEALTELERSEERLARLGQQLDRGLGRRTRVVVLALFGSAWIALDLWAQLTGNVDRYATHHAMFIGSLISLAALGAIVFRARATLMETLINRQLGGALLALLATQALVSAVAPKLGVTPTQAQIMWMLVWSTIATMVTVTIERRMWPLAMSAAISFAVAAGYPPFRIYAMAAVTAAMILNAVALWWREPAESSERGR